MTDGIESNVSRDSKHDKGGEVGVKTVRDGTNISLLKNTDRDKQVFMKLTPRV